MNFIRPDDGRPSSFAVHFAEHARCAFAFRVPRSAFRVPRSNHARVNFRKKASTELALGRCRWGIGSHILAPRIAFPEPLSSFPRPRYRRGNPGPQDGRHDCKSGQPEYPCRLPSPQPGGPDGTSGSHPSGRASRLKCRALKIAPFPPASPDGPPGRLFRVPFSHYEGQ